MTEFHKDRVMVPLVRKAAAVLMLACFTCAGCASDEAAPQDRNLGNHKVRWTRLREGFREPDENLYSTYDKYPGYGILECMIEPGTVEPDFKSRVVEAAKSCRKDFANIDPANFVPRLSYIVVLVRSGKSLERAGCLLELDDVFGTPEQLEASVKKAGIERNAVVYLKDPAVTSPFSVEKDTALPIVERHMKKMSEGKK